MLLRVAWRNVWRNKARSMVIVIAVALGLWGGIFSDAFMQGMSQQLVHSVIYTQTGNIQLNQPGFLVNHDMALTIPNTDSIVTQVENIPGVAGAATDIQIAAMASTASGSAGIMINGINPGEYVKVNELNKMLTEGDYFKDSRANQIVIGQQLADKLKVKLHSRIVVTLQTTAGNIVYGAFRITGIYSTSSTDFDGQTVYVRDDDIRTLVNYLPGQASIITVLLHNNDDTKKVTDAIRGAYPNLQVQPWMELSPLLQMVTGTVQQTAYIFVGIILIALAFGIINTMLMAVLDRTHEIGMLLSIGMKPRLIFSMFMLETVFLSLTGAAAGMAVSIGSIYWFGQKGINLSVVAQGINAFGYSSVVYPTLGVDFYADLALMVFVIAMIAGVFPARRAIRLKPAEAVRGD
ncbi:MAG TPA: ABC transporter permease [Chitinophagaceae bacterium]|nr:ABC transporter permease [Chitinophagaceae bacterium]